MKTRTKQWLDLFSHYSAAASILLIVIQQGIVAFSSFFLTGLIESFQGGRINCQYFHLYLATMILPYLPACISSGATQVWMNSAHKRYCDRLASVAYGATCSHGDRKLQESIESIASRNSFGIVGEYILFVHDFISFALHSLLGMIVIGFLIPVDLVAGYVVSVGLSGAIILCVRGWMKAQAAEVEKGYMHYGDVLSRIWDNAALGNRHSFDLWCERRARSGQAYYGASNRFGWTSQISTLGLAAASLGPTTFLLVHALWTGSAAPAVLAAIVVNLTRIFDLLSSLGGLVHQFLEWSSLNARMNVVFNAEQDLAKRTRVQTVRFGKLAINGIEVESTDQAVMDLTGRTRGRFTLRGDNGSGKSTLLLAMKAALGEKAFLVPAQHGRLCWACDGSEMSTGQKAVARLQELLTVERVDFLLVDEWDANLDAANARVLDELLERESHCRVVIEVRHARAPSTDAEPGTCGAGQRVGAA